MRWSDLRSRSAGAELLGRLVSESPDVHVSGGAIRCFLPAAWRPHAPIRVAEQQKLLAAGDKVAAAQAAASHASAGQTGQRRAAALRDAGE